MHEALGRELLNPVLPGQRGYMAYIRRVSGGGRLDAGYRLTTSQINRLEIAMNPDQPPPYPVTSPVQVADSKKAQATGVKVEASTSGTVPSTEK